MVIYIDRSMLRLPGVMNNGIFLIFFLALILVSCDKDEEVKQFYWEQTKCADPWGTGQNDLNSDTAIALNEFLEDNGITALDIKFDSNSTLDVLCESCGCGTGQRILIVVPETDEEEVENLGFVKA